MLDMWFYLTQQDVCVCVPAKCGGTSFYRRAFGLEQVNYREARSAAVVLASISGQGPYTPEQVMQFYSEKKKYLAIRHPVDRFQSLWRDKCRDGDENMPMLAGWDPDTMIGYINEYPMGNAHWISQYLYRVPGSIVVDSDQLLRTLGFADERSNQTQPAENDPPMPKLEIIRHYHHDYELWRAHAAHS